MTVNMDEGLGWSIVGTLTCTCTCTYTFIAIKCLLFFILVQTRTINNVDVHK